MQNWLKRANCRVAFGCVRCWSRGALFSYGVDQRAIARRVAVYVDRILKGVKPADMPVEQPTTFELVVNMKIARLLGIKVPQSILIQATAVIE